MEAKINIAICEKDSATLRFTKEKAETIIREVGCKHCVIKEFTSPKEMLSSKTIWNIVIMDIEFPNYNGMDVASKIRSENQDTDVIILTKHREIAPKGYRIGVHRFLEKPLSIAELKEAVVSLLERFVLRDRVVISDKESLVSVPKTDIVCIESVGDETCIYLEDKNYITKDTLKSWEDRLGEEFVRNHKSFISNLSKASEINGNTMKMRNNMEVPVSARNLPKIKKLFKQWAV